MTNNVFFKGLVSVAVLSALAVGTAQAATATGNASATLLTPMSVAQTTAMQFGDLVDNAGTGGTVILSTAGTASVTGSVVTTTTGATPAAAVFSVTGDANKAYNFSVPTTITLTSGANTMTVGSLLASVDGAADQSVNATTPATGNTGTGTSTVVIGGTLTVAASQAAGSYAGTYTVSVDYQ